MNRTRIMIAIASSLLVAQIAAAQMMGGNGNHHGSSPPNGSNNPTGGMNGGMNGGSMNGDMGGGMGRSLTVGSDGVVYTLRTSTTTTSQFSSVEVVATRPSGTTAWTAKLDGVMNRLQLSGNLLLVASGDVNMGMNGGNGTALDSSRLVALSAASGSVQWQVNLEGFVAAIEPFSGGVYALIVRQNGTNGGNGMHNGSNGTTFMKRSVAAVDNAGRVLWTLDLN